MAEFVSENCFNCVYTANGLGKPQDTPPIILMTAEVILSDAYGNSEIAHVLFDHGSQGSMANSAKWRKVQPLKTVAKKPKNITGINSAFPISLKTTSKFYIAPKSNPHQRYAIEAYDVPQQVNWNVKVPAWKPEWIKQYKGDLADERILSKKTDLPFTILLDLNYARKLIPNLSSKCIDNLFVDKTPWGIMVSGRYSTEEGPLLVTPEEPVMVAATFTDPDLEEAIEESLEWMTTWELANQESNYDVFGEAVKTTTPAAEEFVEEFWKTIQFDQLGRPTVPLPRNKEFIGTLTTNQKVGKARAKRVLDLLKEGGQRAAEYMAIAEEMISNYMEEVDFEELVASGRPFCELPHHGVYRKDSPSTPLRIVFDGKAADPGTKSLNHFFYVGPNLLPRIQDIIKRFRTYIVCAIGDIKKAFMQVGIPVEDRDYLLFRWHRKNPKGKWVTFWYRLIRLPWGLICSPFVLNAVIRFLFKKLAELHPEFLEILKDIAGDAYVDDILAGAKTHQEAIFKMDIVTKALERGLMMVTKIKSIPPTIADQITGTETPREFKVLGELVDAVRDTIAPSTKGLLKHWGKTTLLKKSAASIVNSVYDPLGQAGPVVLKAKFLWQQFNAAHKKASWTSKLTKEEVKVWMKYLKKAIVLKEMWFPRMIFPKGDQDKKVMVFCDASTKAIGAVAYVVIYEEGEPIASNFFCSTNKTISLDKQSAHERALTRWRDKHGKEYNLAAPPINRLELGGAVMAITLALDICRATKANLTEFQFFTDSRNVLTMLKTNAQGYTEGDAVRRKVKHILGHSDTQAWQHVDTKQNPADLASRGTTPAKLMASVLWKHGPPMLLGLDSPAIEYPVEPIQAPESVFMATTELPHKRRMRHKVTPPEPPRPVLPLTRTNWVESLKVAAKHVKEHMPEVQALIDKGARRMDIYTLVIVSECQRLWEPDLWHGIQLKQLPAALKQKVEQNHLEFFEKDGIQVIISVRRPKMASKDETINDVRKFQHFLAQNHLLYVPTSSSTAFKIVHDAHFNTGHGSLLAMECYLNQNFWIPRVSRIIKKVRKQCIRCKVIDAKCFEIEEAGVHSFRTQGQRAFEVIGVDFTGPWDVIMEDPKKKGKQKGNKGKQNQGICKKKVQAKAQKGQGKEKKAEGDTQQTPSLMIIVDPYTRAICLQPCRNQQTPAVLRALNLFRFSKNAKPGLIISDRGKSFLEKKGLMEITERFCPTAWDLTPSRSPWWGGWYERLNRLIKEKFARLFHRQKFVDFDEFAVAVAYLEMILNNRPIYAAKSHDRNEIFSIRPAQFIYANHEDNVDKNLANILAPLKLEVDKPNELMLKVVQQNDFYRKLNQTFQEHYIMSLNCWHKNALFKHRKGAKDAERIKVGDIVLIRPESQFKANSKWTKVKWRFGEVLEVHPTRNGTIRKVDVLEHLPNGGTRKKTDYTIQHFAPLEINNQFQELMEELKSPAKLPEAAA